MEDKYIVYIKLDSTNRITEINSSAFISDFTNWVKVDGGSGDRYHHAQGNYLPNSLMDSNTGVYNYKYTNGEVVERTEEEKQADIHFASSAPSDSERLAALEKAMLTMMGGTTIV